MAAAVLRSGSCSFNALGGVVWLTTVSAETAARLSDSTEIVVRTDDNCVVRTDDSCGGAETVARL